MTSIKEMYFLFFPKHRKAPMLYWTLDQNHMNRLKHYNYGFWASGTTLNSLLKAAQLPPCINALMLLRNWGIEHTERISVLAKFAPNSTVLNEQSANDQFLDFVTYEEVASILNQCAAGKQGILCKMYRQTRIDLTGDPTVEEIISDASQSTQHCIESLLTHEENTGIGKQGPIAIDQSPKMLNIWTHQPKFDAAANWNGQSTYRNGHAS